MWTSTTRLCCNSLSLCSFLFFCFPLFGLIFSFCLVVGCIDCIANTVLLCFTVGKSNTQRRFKKKKKKLKCIKLLLKTGYHHWYSCSCKVLEPHCGTFYRPLIKKFWASRSFHFMNHFRCFIWVSIYQWEQHWYRPALKIPLKGL